jgi:hypothetical protein
MFKSKTLSILKYNKFTFGEQVVSQFVIFEWKYLFSIIVFYFHKSDGCQDRFHTHAFNAISIKLFGTYEEQIMDSELTGEFHIEKRTSVIKYFPRDSYHRISKSDGCCTILFSGRWKKTWKEYIDGNVVHYNWSRNELN